MKNILSFIAFLCLFTLGSYADVVGNVISKANSVVPEPSRGHVLSLYGKGTPDNISTWYVNYYDPATESHGRVVVLQNGEIDRVHPAEAKSKYGDVWSFDPGLLQVSLGQALDNARDYATKNQLSYNQVVALLRRPSSGKAPVWRIELRKDGSSRGYVYTDGSDRKIVRYEEPSAQKPRNFFGDVRDTFLGIGGDLEEFFTGERTVDQ